MSFLDKHAISKQNAQICDMRAKGIPAREIAVTLGLSLTAVNRRVFWMKKKGLEIPRPTTQSRSARARILGRSKIHTGTLCDMLNELSPEEFAWLKNQQNQEVPLSLWITGLVRDAYLEEVK